MYSGEVSVKEEHLNSFLALAKKLQVRGLCQDGKDPSNDVKTSGLSDEIDHLPAKRVRLNKSEVKRRKEKLEDDNPHEITAIIPTPSDGGCNAIFQAPELAEDYGEHDQEEIAER